MSERVAKRREARLSEVTDFIQYGYTAKSSSDTQGPKYLRITDIQNDHVNWTLVPSVTIDAEDFVRYRLIPGDIVFARSGATVGKSFLIQDDPGNAVFASYLIRVRCNPLQLDAEYASFFFRSQDYWLQIREGASGTGQPNFNGTKLGELRIPIVPIEEQREIVRKLTNLVAHSGTAREELRRASSLIDRLEQAAFAKAFRGELPSNLGETIEIPKAVPDQGRRSGLGEAAPNKKRAE